MERIQLSAAGWGCSTHSLHSFIHLFIQSFTEHQHCASGSDQDKAKSLIMRHSQQGGVAVEKSGGTQGESCLRMSAGTCPRLAGTLAQRASPVASRNKSHKGI